MRPSSIQRDATPAELHSAATVYRKRWEPGAGRREEAGGGFTPTHLLLSPLLTYSPFMTLTAGGLGRGSRPRRNRGRLRGGPGERPGGTALEGRRASRAGRGIRTGPARWPRGSSRGRGSPTPRRGPCARRCPWRRTRPPGGPRLESSNLSSGFPRGVPRRKNRHCLPQHLPRCRIRCHPRERAPGGPCRGPGCRVRAGSAARRAGSSP